MAATLDLSVVDRRDVRSRAAHDMAHIQEEVWTNGCLRITNDETMIPPPTWMYWPGAGWGIGIARRGAYRRSRDRNEQVVDTNTGFLRKHGDEVGLCRIADEPNALTFVSLAPSRLEVLDDVRLTSADFTVTPEIDLLHRRLLAASRAQADALTVETAAVSLIGDAIAQKDARVLSYSRRSTERSRRRLVADACAELHTADQRLGLTDLAKRIGCSPFHLSRVFREITGMTIPQYRGRLRVHAAMAQVADGANDLASVAASAGFSDHSHMTRSIARHYGSPPSRLRELLAASELELLRMRR